jgi:hypothetical protein
MKLLFCISGLVLFQFILHSWLLQQEDPEYDVFLVIAHHKTGTSLAGEEQMQKEAARVKRGNRSLRQHCPTIGCSGQKIYRVYNCSHVIVLSGLLVAVCRANAYVALRCSSQGC